MGALEQACRACGLELDRTATSFRWYAGQRSACAAAIRVPGSTQAHEVGVVAQKGGAYGLQYDPWMGGYGLEARAGAGLVRLRDEYAAAVATTTLARQGYRVVRTQDAQGRLQLRATR